MPYNYTADGFHTNILCSGRSSSEVQCFTENGRVAFLSPFFERLGATHDVHLRLIAKRVVDFLSVLNELFLPWCYDCGATSKTRRQIFA